VRPPEAIRDRLIDLERWKPRQAQLPERLITWGPPVNGCHCAFSELCRP
jgi:hypothetical protein